MSPSRVVVVLASVLATCVALAGPASAARQPTVLHLGVVTRQDVASQPGSEPDTAVQPDVAVSPLNRDVAIAAAQVSRFPDGGAVDLSVAWTADGGAHWHHMPVPGVTKAVGGPYDRASLPVVAFGPDGTAYLSLVAFGTTTCPTAVAVLRSTDGGRTWSRPYYVHESDSCRYFHDKTWLVVDSSPASPHYGRLYQFWTPFLYLQSRFDNGATYVASPQALRWSDDRGATWSQTSYVSPVDELTVNSQPMIRADGTVVDTFYDYGKGVAVPDLVPDMVPAAASQRPLGAPRGAAPAAINATGSVYAATSVDGGATWSEATEVANNASGYAEGVRCCAFGADIDTVTQTMYVVWEGGVADTDPVYLSFSTDGSLWSSPIRVSRGDVSGVQRVNVDVVARNGRVYVGYGTRTQPNRAGGFVQQQLSVSADGGLSFAAPMSIGPRSVLKYAARAGGYFPGDYIGEAITTGRMYMVWAVSSKPPATSTSPYHQVIYGATLQL